MNPFLGCVCLFFFFLSCGLLLVKIFSPFSSYTGPMIHMDVIEKELTIKGFIVTSYKPKFVEGIKELSQWIEEVRKQFSYSFLHPI